MNLKSTKHLEKKAQVKTRISKILQLMNDGLFERKEVIQLTLLSTIAGESIFLLGPPGVAKSMIARRLKYVFKDSKSFEYLMHRFSAPDEIFGPISISKLKEEDKYERKTEHYLPNADVVFLDEIWKAGPSIQNTLLTVINEKVYRNGEQESKVKLKSLIAASNELPAKGEGLEALWDRFILRYLVIGIQDPNTFNNYLISSIEPFVDKVSDKLKISNEEYENWGNRINQVQIPIDCINVINIIRKKVEDYNDRKPDDQPIYISDRRWRKILRILKTSAFLNERQAIDLMDCFLIAHCIWDHPEQIEFVKELVAEAIKNHGYSLIFDLATFREEIDELIDDVKAQTKTTKEVAYYVPKVFKKNKYMDEDYYQIEDPKSKFPSDYSEHKFISVNTYNKLLTQQKFTLISLYNSHWNSMNYEAYKRKPNMLQLRKKNGYRSYRNLESTTFTLTSDKKKKKEYTTIRPHKAVIKDWDGRIKKLVEEIDQTLKQIEDYKDTELAGLKTNLFVDPALAAIPEKNLDQTAKILHSYILDINKQKDFYDGLA